MNNQKILIIFCFLFFVFHTIQKVSAQLDNSLFDKCLHAISNIKDTTYSDLEFLKKEIGSKRLVLLGEDHQDGTNLLARNRIIYFLHQKMGFDVLIDENSFYTSLRMQEYSENQGKDEMWESFSTLYQIYDIGHLSKDKIELWNYLYTHKSKSTKLHYWGMDIQNHYQPNFAKYLEKILNEKNKRILEDSSWIVLRNAISQVASKKFHEVDNTQLKTLEISIDVFLKKHLQTFESDKNSRCFLIPILLQNFLGNIHFYLDFEKIQLKDSTIQIGNNEKLGNALATDVFRDKLMSDNVLWLANKLYPNKKIMIIGGDAHLLKKVPTNLKPYTKDYKPMCEYLCENHPKEVYSIFFLGAAGATGVRIEGLLQKVPNTMSNLSKRQKRKILKEFIPDTSSVKEISIPIISNKEGLEFIFAQRNHDFGFVSLHEMNLLNMSVFYMRLGGTFIQEKWVDFYDAVFLTKKSRPVTLKSIYDMPKHKGILKDQSPPRVLREKIRNWMLENF